MTQIDHNTCATDLDDQVTNGYLTEHGYTIRHIETWHRSGHSDTVILWDIPAISEADLLFQKGKRLGRDERSQPLAM